MKFGIDRLLADSSLRKDLHGRRVALLAHPASVTSDLTHSLDALGTLPGVHLTAAFGPQHGLRGDKQDNMVESPDFLDPQLGIPVFSLYGQVRQPTAAMLETFDVLLIDLQDLGCRIYTFITTLRYVLEAAARHGKSVWVLDRPNPIGRPIEGTSLRVGWESFVGAGEMPMRHGLTLGEMGYWFIRQPCIGRRLPRHRDDRMGAALGTGLRLAARRSNMGQPESERTEPLDGALLSRHRNARRHDTVRRPRHHSSAGAIRCTGRWISRRLCAKCSAWRRSGWQVASCGRAGSSRPFTNITGNSVRACTCMSKTASYAHEAFRPWRLQALAFKALRRLEPAYPLWRDFAYEYEHGRLAIDLINGGESLREWVDDPAATPGDLEALASADEAAWREQSTAVQIYR